jgi:hypothetical protein
MSTYADQRSASTSRSICPLWSARVDAAPDLLFLRDRNSNWLDSKSFPYRLSATIDSRAAFDWRFRSCSSRAPGVVLCQSTEGGRQHRIDTSIVQSCPLALCARKALRLPSSCAMKIKLQSPERNSGPRIGRLINLSRCGGGRGDDSRHR